ncbi:hypothetical protein ABZ671_29465 [Micromonospora sp. NPDC006766]|uniref:hypothetical protein n=1 Tax=Micromonospora sp. NPDC006766 TaxID=3154778 RepID=UPI0033F1C1F1
MDAHDSHLGRGPVGAGIGLANGFVDFGCRDVDRGFDEKGVEVPLDIRRHGPSVDPFTTLVLPSGREVVVEVETGSNNLILDTRFLADCGVGVDDGVTTKTGVDETDHHWTRRWATAQGEVYLAAAPQAAQAQPRVQFQDIIHDGLIGADHLDRYRLHFDVTGPRMILSPHASALRDVS